MDADKALRYCYIGFAIVLALSFLTYQTSPITISLKTADIMTVAPAMFGYLLLLSLIVERAIQVFLSTARGSKAQALDDQIEQETECIKELREYLQQNPQPTTDDDGNLTVENEDTLRDKVKALAKLKNERATYRIRSRCAAQWLGLVIGIMVSIAGVRILGNLVEPTAINALTGTDNQWQINFFILIDVLLTGAVLAGGSEAINLITKRFNNFMEPPKNPPTQANT